MSRTLWLSGRFLSAERARVPATSASVLSGVGIYETLRVVAGRVPLLQRHLRRLRASCAAADLSLGRERWADLLAELSGRNRIRHGRARITIGQGFRLLTLEPLPRALERERRNGIRLVSAEHVRAAPALKGTSRLDLWLAERGRHGEVLLLGARGRVLETSRSNFFAVTARGLETAPDHVLPGIARALVLEAARDLGIPVRLRAPTLAAASRWREAFVTNALRGVRPVRQIDRQRLPVPKADSVTRSLQDALDRRMELG